MVCVSVRCASASAGCSGARHIPLEGLACRRLPTPAVNHRLPAAAAAAAAGPTGAAERSRTSPRRRPAGGSAPVRKKDYRCSS
eukprot:scaffold87_cov388-Prasinococcus_capsulatus_cf.AAC.7